MKKRLLWLVLLGAVHTSWAEEILIYYTSDPMASFQNIQTRLVPIDMTVQKFLETLQPPLPPLDAHTIWTLSTKEYIRVNPGDLVASNNQTGKAANTPWIITRVAIGL